MLCNSWKVQCGVQYCKILQNIAQYCKMQRISCGLTVRAKQFYRSYKTSRAPARQPETGLLWFGNRNENLFHFQKFSGACEATYKPQARQWQIRSSQNISFNPFNFCFIQHWAFCVEWIAAVDSSFICKQRKKQNWQNLCKHFDDGDDGYNLVSTYWLKSWFT